MNGTLLAPRPYSRQDMFIQNFMKEQSLETLDSTQHTFAHHSDNSCSQIDYILSTDRNMCNLEKMLKTLPTT